MSLKNVEIGSFILVKVLPKEYLTDLLDNQKVDALISVFTTNPDVEYLPEYLRDLDDLIHDRGVEVHLTGYQFNDFSEKNLEITYTFTAH